MSQWPPVLRRAGMRRIISILYPTEHDTFFAQTCLEEVENAEYVAPLKPLLFMRVQDPLDEDLDPRSRLREYVDSKRRLVAKKLCYAKLTRRSWPLKQGCMGDLSQLKEALEQKITTWQREVDFQLIKSVWVAHVRTLRKMNNQRNVYVNPHERAYVAIVHRRRILPRAKSQWGTTSRLLLPRGQATYIQTRTSMTRLNYWTRGCRSL